MEIEIKVCIEKNKELLKFLKENAEYEGEQRQLDEYFSPVEKDFLKKDPVEEWLRLRTSGGKSSLNYKRWHFGPDGKSNHCTEHETSVLNASLLRTILLELGFKSIVRVDKIRKIWTYGDYEIAVDQVRGLQDFVEVEYKGKAKKPDPKKIVQDMLGFLKDLHCGKITRNFQGYPYLLLFPKKARFEKV